MDENQEIVREFLVESYENLDQLDRDLIALESEPGSRALLSSIFRTVHTIKGTSGFLGMTRLERVTHVGESLLVELRDGQRSMDQPTTDVLLSLTDTVRAILSSVEATGEEGEADIDAVISAVEAIQAGPAGAEAKGAAVENEAVEAEQSEQVAQDEQHEQEETLEPQEAPELVEAVVASSAAEAPSGGTRTSKRRIGSRKKSGGEKSRGTKVPEQRPAPAEPPVAAAAAPAPTSAPAKRPAAVSEETQAASRATGSDTTRSASDTTIRVDVDVLDALMRQVGELVLTRNQISRIAQGSVEQDLVRAAQQLNLIAGELQEGVMKTRMQPIEHLWSKMPRVVRDLATSMGRDVALEMIGKDTELDRSLLEAVKDPLTHLVRNAVDHGIEVPADRVKAGKPAKGTLTLHAYHSGGQVVVEVRDDGRGVDGDKLAAAAVRKGLKTPDQIATASPNDLLQLLFLPGFSTAEKVTNVSGRGVGMDVVKTKIEEIGGTVELESVMGEGTTCRLRIPLTLAIMPTLTVACAGDLYAVPQVNLVELVALDSSKEDSGVEHVHSAPVYRLRGELLPLVSMAEVLGVDAQPPTVIAVLQAEGRRFGLLLDRVVNTEEIVVKPLSSRLKSIGLYAGATVLGDGRVALILDVQAIARTSMLVDVQPAETGGSDAEAVDRSIEQVLVVGVGGHRVAMPLASVARLEHVLASSVEVVGGRQVVQYRDTILPLLHLGTLLGTMVPHDAEELLVVVYSNGHRSVGMVVDDILDILDDDVRAHSDTADSGLVGSTVLSGVITELLDVRAAILAVDPSFYDEADASYTDLVGAIR
ncbi:MAG: chemotaxis protein CheA [Micrococcales bacterium]|nr:chemotaxis protein CheA [Micrococcales bacterium]